MADTLEDFIQKYKNTFCFLKYKDKSILAEYVDNIDKNIIFLSQEYGKIIIKQEHAEEILDIRFPKKGLYNLSNIGFQFFYRVPERQYKRSPCNKNCAILNVLPFGPQVNVDKNSIEKCFFPEYPETKQKAIKLINKNGGVALSDKFGVSLSDTADFNLYLYSSFIGTITNDKINIEYIPVAQEVIDHFGKDLVWKN